MLRPVRGLGCLVLEPRPLSVVLCAVLADEHILMIERAHDPYRGYLALPGGKLDFGESISQAARREIREETGLETEFLSVAGVATETIQSDSLEKHFVLFVVLLSTQEQVLTASSEGPVSWVSLTSLSSEKLIETDRDLIERFVLPRKLIDVPHFSVLRKGDDFSINTID